MKVLLTYKQRERKPDEFVERWGTKVIQVGIGFVDYDQEEEIEEDLVEERIKELKSFTNRRYHSFKSEKLA